MNGRLAFDISWVDPERAHGAELAATWASLRVSVSLDGEQSACLTEIHDRSTGSAREYVFVPLYPLAEWLVANWWHILYEPEGIELNRTSPDFQRRHNMLHAGDGYFFPSVMLIADGEGDDGLIEVVPEARSTPLRRYILPETRFLAIETVRVKEDLSGFVDAVVGRLEDRGIQNTYLQNEWSEILRVDTELGDFCRYTAMAGLDPNEIDEETANEFARIGELVPRTEWNALFGNAGPGLDSLRAAATSLVSSKEHLQSVDRPTPVVSELRERLRGFEAPRPWLSGYRIAREVRTMLSMKQQRFGSFESLQQVFGLEDAHRDEIMRFVPDLPVDGVVGVNTAGGLGVDMKARDGTEASNTFLFCRCVAEFLLDGSDAQHIVSRSKNARQKLNRAFAAEFLAPAELLRESISTPSVSTPSVSLEELEQLGVDFGVSVMVIAHQLENHRIAVPEPY